MTFLKKKLGHENFDFDLISRTPPPINFNFKEGGGATFFKQNSPTMLDGEFIIFFWTNLIITLNLSLYSFVINLIYTCSKYRSNPYIC